MFRQGSVNKRNTQQQGWSLIEALVALVLLVVGILGLVALQSSALQGNYQAYQRSQAAILSQDLAERVRVWRLQADSYNFPAPGDLLECSDWTSAINSPQADRDEWLNLVACRLPRSRAGITIDSRVLDVIVFWNCDSDGSCASYRYITEF